MTWIRWTIVAVVTTLALAWLVVRPDQLYVERVVFEGQVRATPAELRHLADLRNGTTIWGVDLDRITAGVQRHPWVERVEAERRLPNTVVVRVEEYAPVALLSFDDGLYYIDDSGVPFLKADSADLDHPVLTGIDAALERAHPELPRLVIRDALWLLDEIDARKLLSRDRVSEVAFHRTHGFTIRTVGAHGEHHTAEVLMALSDYERQLRRLAALLDRGVDLTESLHVDLAPERVAIVRPQQVSPSGLLTQ